jgi:hypothetical protein
VLDVVTFKWKPPSGYRSTFGPEAVNTLSRMVARHYGEHRFTCITDDPAGIDPHIRIVPLWDEFADVRSPHGGGNPSCYRRLKLFSTEAASIVGAEFVVMDLDSVVTGDLRPIFDRPEDFVVWGETDPRSWYNGSLWRLKAGTRTQVYDTFDPVHSPQKARAAGKFGSDQGWLSYVLGPGEATWTRKDGVYSYRVHIQPKGPTLPKDAKLVCFHGKHDPWSPQCRDVPWIKTNYA